MAQDPTTYRSRAEDARSGGPDAPLVWLWAALLGALSCWLFWPGLMSFDSIYMYRQVMGDLPLNNYHPPAMVLSWRAVAPLAGPGGMLLLHQMLYWSGLALIVQAVCLSLPARLTCLTLIGLLPPLWIHAATVWNDSGVVAAWLFATGCILWLAHSGGRGWLIAGLLSLAYGMLLRHNALFAALPLFLALADARFTERGGQIAGARPYLRRVAPPALAAFVIVLLAGQLLERAPAAKMTKWTTIAVWDLAAVSIFENRLILPRSALNFPEESDGQALSRLRDTFRPEVNGPLIAAADLFPRNGNESELLAAWLTLPLQHTRAYLAHRTRVFLGLLGLGQVPMNLAYQGTTESNEYGLEMVPERQPLRQTALRGIEWSAGTVLFRPWLYLLLLVIAAGYLLMRGRAAAGAAQRLPLYLTASGLLNLLPLYVLAPATDFRYLLWLVAVSAVLCCSVLFGRQTASSGANSMRQEGE